MNSILLARLLHAGFVLYFFICIFYIYYCVIFGIENAFLYISIISLLIEGLVVFLNNSDCPLGAFHKKAGDNKTFFEVFVPKPIAKQAIPFFAIVAMGGLLLYFFQKLVLKLS